MAAWLFQLGDFMPHGDFGQYLSEGAIRHFYSALGCESGYVEILEFPSKSDKPRIVYHAYIHGFNHLVLAFTTVEEVERLHATCSVDEVVDLIKRKRFSSDNLKSKLYSLGKDSPWFFCSLIKVVAIPDIFCTPIIPILMKECWIGVILPTLGLADNGGYRVLCAHTVRVLLQKNQFVAKWWERFFKRNCRTELIFSANACRDFS